MADKFTKFLVNTKSGRPETIVSTQAAISDVRSNQLRVGSREMPGTDTHFFVSGSIGGKTATKPIGVSAFGGDVFVSGSFIANSGISGSLTNLADGRSYLSAGSSITIVTGSDGQITINSTGAGSAGGWTTGSATVRLTTNSDQVAIGTNTPDGKVRILSSLDPITGTTDPSAFHLYIQQSSQTNGKSAGIAFGTTNNNVGSAIIYQDSGSYAKGDLAFFTKETTDNRGQPNEAMRIKASGYVGIGTYVPAAKLEVETSTSDSADAVVIDANETGPYYGLLVDSESTSVPAIKATGYGGAFLQQDITSGYGLYVYRNISEGGSQPLVQFKDDNANNTQTTLKVTQDGTGDLVNFLTGSTEVVTINNKGQLGVGTAAPNEKITVEGAISLDEVAGAPSATSGYGKLYVKNSDSKLYFKNDSGSEFDLLAGAAGAPADAQYVTLATNGTLSAERVLSGSSGITITDGGAGNNVTLSVSANTSDFDFLLGVLNLEDSVVKTISGDSGTTTPASHGFSAVGGPGITTKGNGSRLEISGTNATTSVKGVASFAIGDFTVSAGHVSLDEDIVKQGATDSGTASASSHALTFAGGTGISTSGASSTVTYAIDNSVVATVSGTRFTGATIHAQGLSGSLTKLSDGRSYLLAGENISIASSSNGQVTISSTGVGGAGDPNATYLVLTATGSLTRERVFTDGTGITSTDGGSGGAFTVAINDSVVATVSGTQFTGPVGITPNLNVTGSAFIDGNVHVGGYVTASMGLSGSLTRLADGRTYLVAGSNVTITSASNGQVTIASSGGGGGGSITVKENDGSPSVSSVTTISFDNAIVTDVGSNTVVISGTIGTAEDGDYSDGLFTTFTNKTYTGVAIDKINEVLKELAPSPAPNLDDINAMATGKTVSLSFGSSNTISGYTNVGGSAGLGAAVDVNGVYQVATSSNNIRIAAFNLTQSMSGVLNADVARGLSGAVLNFVSQSFGNGEQGYLHLEVNGAVIATASLSSSFGTNAPGSGSAQLLTAAGSGFTNFSTTGSAVKEDGSAFTFFQHRTGRYLISTSSQRNGWNYARILHFADGVNLNTNYIEWVNDSNSDALAASGNSATPEMSGSVHLSGVEYYISGNVRYKVAVSNAYRNTYDTNNITFTTTNCNISAQSKPTIGAGENHTKVLHLTGVGVISQTVMLTGSVTASVNVTHPFKSDLTSGGEAAASGILMYGLSGSSTALVEKFRVETFRIQSGSYNAQSDVTSGGNAWSSNVFMTASNGGHSNGLQFFSSSLRSPLNTIFGGDFRNASDGGSVTHGPSGNPNYSSQSGQRTFYRHFRNETGFTHYTARIAMSGSAGTIVGSSTALNSSRLRVFLKIPSGTAGSTGWLDLASAFSFGSYEDNNGCLDGTLDSSLNAINNANFGVQGIANNEYICMRVEADASWTGQIDEIEVSFGAGTGTTATAPVLSRIDADSTGVTSKLSFGASKAISGYTSVAASAGIAAAVDVNGIYQVATSSNNIRAATFDGSTTFEGDLNPQVAASSPSYVAKSFDQALTGTLTLEVNGAPLHVVTLTGSVGTGNPGSGTGIFTASNGSGFVNLSTYAPAEFSNGVKDYTKLYRTGKYRVSTTDQRNGWNYARVIHAVTGTNRTTTYTEWVNDNDSNALTITNLSMGNFGVGATSPYYQSGIGYFVNCTSSIKYQSSNAYKKVYSNLASAITTPTETNLTIDNIIVSGTGVTAQLDSGDNSTLAALLTGVSDSQDLPIFVTHSVSFSQSESLPGPFGSSALSVTGTVRVKHPLKSNVTSAAVSKGVFLVFTSSNTSDLNNNEHFTSETYRIQSGTYSNQTSVTASANAWSSTTSMNNASDRGHYAGALVYNDQMISPLSGVLGGDYRSAGDGGSIQAPAGNPNYSSLAIQHREYERYFKNNTSNDVPQITITLYGDAVIVGRSGANSGSLGGNKNIHVDVKIPGKTGYLDLAKPSPGAGSTGDGAGGLSGDLTSAVGGSGASNICTFNGVTLDGTASAAELVVIRLVSDRKFTGNISRIQVAYS